ncbi:NAD(P)-dependent oxidoreductase [Bradyrhizobium sp. sBnM-33]|uniref:NAD-dependent epimerase/dehydratase family protein n=1 Tax=Bradyrhizobium sp. sBnM-33 TaxID=2831780 RepID=UPI001BD0731A|nr:SDR family oxidoreductase [Bradyrhizobium sp. sBnM-33]WOH53670.1 SDR family oxidoreductase [Bradyrhizobium sp. sBnM-33]
MKILITGNMGYVGPVVVRHLRSRWPDAELIGFDNAYFARCLTTRRPLPELDLTAQQFGDTRELPAAILKGVDAVVHLAAVSNDPMGKSFEEPTDQINYRASRRIAEMAQQASVGHFVFASSCSVYGFAAGRPMSETDELNPLTAYARSKIATERALADTKLGEMVVTCLRFATACGASDRIRLDLVLNDFVASAIASGEIKVLSDGTPWRPLINVSDMARAIEWAVQRPATSGGPCLALNVGSNVWNYQVAQLAEAVAHEIPGTSVSMNPNAEPDRRSYQVDFSRFAELAPKHQPIATLPQTVQGLRDRLVEIGFADREFRNSDLVRLKTLERYVGTGQLTQDLRWAES